MSSLGAKVHLHQFIPPRLGTYPNRLFLLESHLAC